jgi:hypothetical protein
MTNDGKIVVSDRGNNRIQVFEKDGKYVREYPVLRDQHGTRRDWLDRVLARQGPELLVHLG